MNKSLLNSVKIDFRPHSGVLNPIFFTSDRYGFNGKEKDDEHSQGKYDFGARIYDTRLGRWLAIDPEVALYPFASPYNFALNKPIIFIDVDGGVIFDKDGNRVTVTVSEGAEGKTITVTGTDDEALKTMIKDGYQAGGTQQEMLENLNSADVYAKVITHEKRIFCESEGDNVGEVDGLSDSRKPTKQEKKLVPGATATYIIQIGNVSGESQEITEENFTTYDVYGDHDIETPYTIQEKEDIAQQAVKDLKSKILKKVHQGHQASLKALSEDDQKLWDEIIELEEKDDKFRINNTIIYESANAAAQSSSSKKTEALTGELAGKKAVIKAYKESKAKQSKKESSSDNGGVNNNDATPKKDNKKVGK